MRKRGGSGSAAQNIAEEDDGMLTTMGRFYTAVLNFSVVTRYFVYVLPLALVLAVPIIVGATVAPKAKIGGIRIVWLFTWIEIGKMTLPMMDLASSFQHIRIWNSMSNVLSMLSFSGSSIGTNARISGISGYDRHCD
jgi:hypothetical protein